MPDDTAAIPCLAKFIETALPLILEAVDPGRAIAMVESIVENDRWNSFDRWHETSRRLQSAYEACGARAEITSIPTGGQRGTGRWIIPEAADVVSATLDLVEPSARRLADYRDCPWHVAQWSAATPAAGLRCELIAVDSPEQLASAAPGSLAGKMVLTRLDPWMNRAQFCAAGAEGLVCDNPVPDHPDAVAWTKFGWGGLDFWNDAPALVGFSISATAGDSLRALLQQGASLVVDAKLDIRRHAGTHDVVSRYDPWGEDPDAEIWAIAHSCEPGALDNASGGAACVEIARALTELIARGRLPQPRRTIRFLHAYECYGFFHYLEHTPRLQPPLAGVCIDTIGARPDVCQGNLSWHATAPGSAAFVDAIGFELLRATLAARPVYRLVKKPFLSTEDTLLGDPRYGFPCPWITNHPCRGYHSSADTLDLVDPQGMAACTAAMAAYLYFLADASTEEAEQIVRSQTRTTVERMRTNAVANLSVANVALREQHQASIDGLRRYATRGDHATIAHEFATQIATVAAEFASVPRLDQQVDASDVRRRLIAVRKKPLAPTPENVGPVRKRLLDAAFPKWAAYWADGKRSLAEIAALTALNDDRQRTLGEFADHFEALAALGYVELHDRDDFRTVEQLAADLATLGVRGGTDIMVHSSMKSIGLVRGGPSIVIDAILAVIGPEGTLLAPSFNHFQAQVFNPLTTPTTNGAIADTLWRRPDAHRSLHPSHSVAAIGPRAEDYVRDHLQNGIWAPDSPIGRLIDSGGYILSIGVGHNRTTAYHLAEIELGAPCLDSFGSRDKIISSDGKVQTVPGLAWRNGECPVDPAGLDSMLADKQSVGRVGKARATLVRAIDVFNARARATRRSLPKLCDPAGT